MIGSRLLDRYELVGVLGRGGMGVVYRAHDPQLDREVAVKMIPPTVLSEEAETRFRREARLVAGLDHPAITPIFDFGVHEGSLFLVMPVLAGETLDALIGRGDLRLGETLEIIAQAADALDYSHERGVVHRDIKPDNLMIQRRDGHPPRVRVLDFGLAVARRADRFTRTGQLFGTLAYVSPERAGGTAKEDARSDLYSLAAVLYECLAGEPPFTGAPTSLLYRIVHEHPMSFQDRGLHIDPELEWVVLGCLAKDPEERLRRGAELATALRRVADCLGDGERTEHRTMRMPAMPAMLRDGPMARVPLIGRDPEIRRLQQRLQTVTTGGTELVLLGGDTGIGKSRTVEEIAELARIRGMRVFSGRFSEPESTLPYQGFTELILDAVRQRKSDGLVVDLRDLAAELRRFLPALGDLPEIGDVSRETSVAPLAETAEDSAARRGALLELLARTLSRLGGGEPTLLVLESLHHADRSLEALPYVVRRLGGVPTLVIGTYRTDEVGIGHPLRRLVTAYQGDPSFVHLTLGSLAPGHHRDLVRALVDDEPVSDELAERLFDSTEGNPLFTRELVRSMSEAGSLARDDSGVWILSGEAATSRDAVPQTVQQVISARIDRLPSDHRHILATASVLGRSFAFEDLDGLATAVGTEAVDLEPVVDALIESGHFVERSVGRVETLQFASSVVQEVLYAGVSRRRRRLLHRRHAEDLERRTADRPGRHQPRLLHHFVEGDVPEKAVRHGRALAENALASHQIPEAIRAAEVALSFAADVALPPVDEGALCRLLAVAQRADGRLEAAQRSAERAAKTLAGAAETAGAMAAYLLAAEIAWQARHVAATRRLVDRGVGLAATGVANETLHALLVLGATVANLLGHHGEAQAHLDRAAPLLPKRAEEPDDHLDGGTLVTVLPNRVTCLEPGSHEVVEDTEVLAMIFETLVRTDPTSGQPVPGLCQAWTLSDDGRRFRFRIRPEVVFSDGTPLTAGDVVASLERSARGRPGSMEVVAFDAIEGCRAFERGEAEHIAGLTAIDDEHVEFRLEEPLPIFPVLLSDPGTGIGRQAENGLLGTGPFRLTSQSDDLVEVERNDRYWGRKTAHVERVRLRLDLRAEGIAEAIRGGRVDIGRDMAPGDLEDVQRDPRFRGTLVETVKRNVHFLLFHSAGPRSRHPEVRAALSQVLRVQDLVWRTLGRFAQPAVGLVPPGILGHDPGLRRKTLTTDEARASLERLGSREPLVIRAGIHPQWLDRYRGLKEAIFEVWATCGVQVEVVGSTLDDYLPLARAKDGVDVLFGRWFADYDDPDNFTYGLLHSRAGHYRRFWNSAEADALFERARLEQRLDIRQQLYRRIERQVAAESIALPMFHDIDYRLPGPRVRGLRLLPSAPFVDYREIALVGERGDVESAVRTFPERGTVRVATTGRLDDLDPARSLLTDAAEIVPNVFETLLRVDDSARLSPGLAERHAVEDSGRRVRLFLRQGVRFHDGRRLTVRDVRYSFERLLRSPIPGAAGRLMAIEGGEAYRSGREEELKGLELISDRELVIHLAQPVACFPAQLSTPVTAIVPDGAERFDGNWRLGCAGTGPFRLVHFDPRERVELEAHAAYWSRGLPRCERLIFELGTDRSAALEGFRRGRLALANVLSAADVESLADDPELAAGHAEAPGLGTYYLLFNTRSGPLADVAVRRSLAGLLDPPSMVPATVGRLGRPAHGLIPPGLPGYEATPRSSGIRVPTPVSLVGLSLRVGLHPSYRERYARLWDRIADAWAAAGVQLDVRSLEGGEVLTTESELDVLATRWLADYPDSDSFAGLLHSRDGLDRALCQDPTTDEMVARGRCEHEPSLRHAAYRELERHWLREAQLVPLFYEQVICFARPEVVGLHLGMGRPAVAYQRLRRLL